MGYGLLPKSARSQWECRWEEWPLSWTQLGLEVLGGAACSAANPKSEGQPDVLRGRCGSLEVAGGSDLAGVNQDCRHLSSGAVEQLGEMAWLFLHGH